MVSTMAPEVGTRWYRYFPDRCWIVTGVRPGRTGAPVVMLKPDFDTDLGPMEWPVRATRRRAPFATAWKAA